MAKIVNIFGGYKVQGRGDEAADRLLSEALALEAAGRRTERRLLPRTDDSVWSE